ncbi:hypothetical protein SK128_012826, partial [Halocaridina rubra]
MGEKRGLNLIESLDDIATILFKRDLYALFHNCILYMLESMIAQLERVTTLMEWDDFSSSVTDKFDRINAIAEKLNVKSDDKTILLLDNFVSKVKSFSNNSDILNVKRQVEEYIDSFIKEVTTYLDMNKQFNDEQSFLKNIEWDEAKPFTIKNVYHKLMGKDPHELVEIIRVIRSIMVEELEALDEEPDPSPNIVGVKQKLVRFVEEIDAETHTVNVKMNDVINTLKKGFRLFINKHQKRSIVSTGKSGGSDDQSFSIVENICVNPGMIYKFISLFEFYRKGLNIDDADNIDQDALDVCHDSAYNKYYVKVYHILRKYLTPFKSETVCSPIRKNIYHYVFMVIRRMTKEVFGNPFSINGQLISNRDKFTLDFCRDYVKRLKEDSLIVDNGPLTSSNLVNLGLIIKYFNKTDERLVEDATVLYQKHRDEFIRRIGKHVEITYGILEKESNVNCPLFDSSDPSSPIFADRAIYKNLVSVFNDLSESDRDKVQVDAVLSHILKLENKYVKYISESELLPPSISRDKAVDVDHEKLNAYEEMIVELREEWDAFKLHTTAFNNGFLGKIDIKNEKLLNSLSAVINSEGDVDGLLAVFKKLLLMDFGRDEKTLNDDIVALKKTIAQGRKEAMHSEIDGMKKLIVDSSLSDSIKLKLKKYLDNDLKLKHNLQLLSDNKVNPSIVESLFDSKDDETLSEYKKMEGEMTSLKDKLTELESLRESYNKIGSILFKGGKGTETQTVKEINDLVNKVKSDELIIENHEKNVKKLNGMVSHLQDKLSEEMEKGDGKVNDLKYDYEREMREKKIENEKLHEEKDRLLSQIKSLNSDRERIEERYVSLKTEIDACETDNSRLSETVKNISNLEAQLDNQTLKEGECSDNLKSVNQSLEKMVSDLNESQKQMDVDRRKLHEEKEQLIKKYSEEIDKCSAVRHDLEDKIERLENESKENLRTIAKLYSSIEGVDTLKDVVDRIEKRNRELAAVRDEHGQMLKVLAEYNVDDLPTFLSTVQDNSERLGRMYKNLTKDMCFVFDKYEIDSSMCREMDVGDDDNAANREEPFLKLKEEGFPKLLQLISDREAYVVQMENMVKEKDREIKGVKETIAQKELALTDARKIYDNLLEEYAKNDCKGKLNDLNQEIKSLKVEKQSMSNDLSKKKTVDADVKRLKSDVEDLAAKIEALTQVKAQLTDEVNEYKKKKRDSDKEIKDLKSANAKLEKEQSAIRESVQSKGVRIDELLNDVRVLEKSKVDVETEVSKLNELNKKLTEKYDEGVDALKTEYKQQMGERMDAITDLELKLNDAERRLSGADAEFKTLQTELFKYKTYKDDMERANREIEARLVRSDKNYESETQRSRKLNEEIVRLKSVIGDLTSTNSVLKQTVDSLKEKNSSLDRSIERLNKLQEKNQILNDEKRKLLTQVDDLKRIKARHVALSREIEGFAKNIKLYTSSLDENDGLVDVLGEARKQFLALESQNSDYSKLIQDYEDRFKIYQDELKSVESSVFDELNEKYASAQLEYESVIKRLKADLKTCDNNLGKCDNDIRVVYNVRDEMQKELDALKKENERLKDKCANVRHNISSMRGEEIVPPVDCPEQLARAHDKRRQMFGDNVEELVRKVSEKKQALDNYDGDDASIKSMVQKMVKYDGDVLADLSLPTNCNKLKETMIVLNNIDKNYKAIDEYILDVHDAYSDIFQMGHVYVRLKPPISSGTYKYNPNRPVVSIKKSPGKFAKNTVYLGDKHYQVDSIFEEDVNNFEIYKTIKPTLSAVKKGKNVFILVYGQTGSGKSYTVVGSKGEKGLLPHIHNYAKSLDANIMVKLFGLHNNNIYDLSKIERGNLETKDKGPPESAKVNNVRSVNTLNKTANVSKTIERVMVTRKTKFNDRSSRAHMFIELYLPHYQSSIIMVDLCGNEKTSALSDDKFVRDESVYINTSLVEIGTHFLERFRRGDVHTTS